MVWKQNIVMNKEQIKFKKVVKSRKRHQGKVQILKDYNINRSRGGKQVIQKKK